MIKRSYKRNFQRKTSPRVKIRISRKMTMVSENVISIGSLTNNLLNTSSILFLRLADHTLQRAWKMCLLLKEEMNFSKSSFSLQL